MKKSISRLALGSILMFVGFNSAIALADQWKRCKEDALEDTAGRLAWALKCEMLDRDDFDFCSARPYYPSFERSQSGEFAPITESADCEPGKWRLESRVLCFWGMQ